MPLAWRATTNNSARWPLPTLQLKDQALPAARREAFSRDFCAAFHVPTSQPSLVGFITTSRQRRWMESVLAEKRST